MPVALDDLGAHGVRVEAQLRERRRFDARTELGVGAHGARDLARRDVVGRGTQPCPGTVELERPARELESEGGRLGVDGVGAAHDPGVGVLTRPLAKHRDGRVELPDQQLASGLALERQTGVDDIGAGEPQVEPAALLAHRLGDLAHEGDDVVVGGPLDLGDPFDVHPPPGLDGLDRGRGHRTLRRERMEHRDLDPEHRLEARLVAPHGAHPRQRVAGDHATAPVAASSPDRPMSRRSCIPGNRTYPAAR